MSRDLGVHHHVAGICLSATPESHLGETDLNSGQSKPFHGVREAAPNNELKRLLDKLAQAFEALSNQPRS
jgi:hypothetical protein